MSKTPEEVFTPKSGTINLDMYVERQGLEAALLDKINGDFNIIIHGESGSGKTWLYKKIFGQYDISYEIINLAQVARFQTLTNTIQKKVDKYKKEYVTQVKRTNEVKLSLIDKLLSLGIKEETITQLPENDPVESIFEILFLSQNSSGKRSYLVLDNLESIFSDDTAMKELSSLIMLQDDIDFEHFNVRLLIVGVPNGIKDYFSRFAEGENIKNRLTEIPEVARLSSEECEVLLQKGFIEKLEYIFDGSLFGFTALQSHVQWITDRIPQRVQEYCLELAKIIQSNHCIFEYNHLEQANQKWLKERLSADYSVVESRMNAKDTKEQRRNQVLYALGQYDHNEFKASQIEPVVRRIFNVDNKIKLDISGTLSQLSREQSIKSSSEPLKPILKKNANGESYSFADPKYLMCLRTMLKLTEDKKIEKIAISEV